MPIGPTDPDAVAAVAKDPSTEWSGNHLLVTEGGAQVSKWLHVDTVANAWTLVTSSDVLIDEDTFRDLRASEPTAGNLIKVNGIRKQLAPAPLFGSTWAVLIDP